MNIYLKFLLVILLLFFNPRVVKDTIGSIAESEKEVESAARGMEYIIRWVSIALQCTISVTINA